MRQWANGNVIFSTCADLHLLDPLGRIFGAVVIDAGPDEDSVCSHASLAAGFGTWLIQQRRVPEIG
jgi:hypothetical protein